MPQTPALDTSSITPVSPGSQFPVTPTSCSDNLHQSMQPKFLGEPETPTMNRSDRELDPTTLFVGGLEMFGPGAWDEEKVKNFFARFGGLESVKVVRPRKFFPLPLINDVIISFLISEFMRRFRICQVQQCRITCSCSF